MPEITDWELAVDALTNHGCDCGTDEPGTCLACICEAALRTERAQVERLQARFAAIRAWSQAYGAELCPESTSSADTYGEGVRACKAAVSRLL